MDKSIVSPFFDSRCISPKPNTVNTRCNGKQQRLLQQLWRLLWRSVATKIALRIYSVDAFVKWLCKSAN